MRNRNEGFCFRERLGPLPPRTTAITYLADRYHHSSAEDWHERIDAGLVRLHDRAIAPDTEVREGDLLTWHRPAWIEEPAPLSFAVLHRDEHLLAVAKPAGLPTLPGGGFLNHTLLAQVRRHYPEAAPVHRLGRWTSGIVLFGRTREARARLTDVWKSKQVVKVYRALVRGSIETSEFAIDVPIGPVACPPLGTVHAASPNGKIALTRVRVLEDRGDSSLVEAIIETGRPHQIRIHLAAAGHPLVGDPLYAAGGSPIEGGSALPGDGGYWLHACRLEIAHPATCEHVRIECEAGEPLRTSPTGRESLAERSTA